MGKRNSVNKEEKSSTLDKVQKESTLADEKPKFSGLTLEDQLSKCIEERAVLVKTVVEQEKQLAVMSKSIDQIHLSTSRELEKIKEDLTSMKNRCESTIKTYDKPFSKEKSEFFRPPSAIAESEQLQYIYGSSKVFRNRNSLLTDLLSVQDFRTIYHIFVAVFIIVCSSIICDNYLTDGTIVDFSILTTAFGSLDVVGKTWTAMFFYTIAGYVWKDVYLDFRLHISLYILYQLVLFLFALLMTLNNSLPMASAFIVMCEQTRFTMKVHSFWRAHLFGPPASRQGEKSLYKTDSTIQHYLYFLFCPTLLYRTNYPRTPYVRWLEVFKSFVECSFIVLYLYVLFESYLVPIFKTFPSDPGVKHLVMSIFHAIIPSITIFLFGFFGFLHTWLNMFAELLQFGDRRFYQDWWNSNSFSEYYRKWNGVVYDWLYAYVYTDAIQYLQSVKFGRKTSKAIASLFVIEFSALIHEIILACAFGFWFPFLWITYGGPGILFGYLNSRSVRKSADNNIFVWSMLIYGMGMLVVVYARESFIRQSYIDPNLSVFEWSYWKQFVTSYSVESLTSELYAKYMNK